MNGRESTRRNASLKVLVLHQHYWPEIAATAQILTDLCEDLASRGHQVTVVCGQPSYRVLEQGKRLPAVEHRRGVEIRRVWSYTPQERSIPRRLLHYGSYFASSLAASLANTRPDVCFVMSTPPLLLGLSGTLLKALRAVPFLYSVQDLYPDIAIHLGVIRQGGLAAKTIEKVTRIFYAQAAGLVALSPGMATALVRKGVRTDRVHVIPNWADTDLVTPTARHNRLSSAFGCDDHFVVQYSGNLGMSQGLEGVVAAAALLRDLPIRFAFVGDGNARRRLEALVSASALSNVSFHPPQAREDLSELLGACDVGLVTMKRDVGNDLVPSKLYGIMAAARPVLAAVEPSSEVARVVRAHDCGLVVPPEDPEALAQAIRGLFARKASQRAEMGARGRDACITQYSRDVLTARYANLITQIAAPTRQHQAAPSTSENTPRGTQTWPSS
jgi:glycosyltransferase involved in cell wall biosynthesis